MRAKTGKGWAEWFALLDKAEAAKWSHKDIAIHLHQCDCPDWWAQMVTVGYEQARGLRVKHQTADGFSASASKTIDASLAALFAAGTDARRRKSWLPEASAFEVKRVTDGKSMRLLRAGDSSSIEVRFYAKADAKSQITIEQNKLASAEDVARVKAFWAAVLGKLKELLERASSVKPALAKARRPATAAPGVKKKS